MVEAVVRRVWRETPKLTGVVLEIDEDVAKQYTRPGQVVVLRPNEKDKVYLAIASSPGEAAAIELLMGDAVEGKVKPASGRALILDPPHGKGFPVEMAEGKDVLLFAVGSGLAPIRPLVNLIRSRRSDYGRVVLYAGAHSAEHFPYRSEFEGWKRDRIDVVRSISKPWVQEMFERDPVPVDDAVAYVCGMKEMMESVTKTLVAAGMPAERIGRNW
jgi:NAD(P)H-flavin reductase